MLCDLTSMATAHEDVVVEGNPDDGVRATMTFDNGVAVYVFARRPMTSYEIPEYLQAMARGIKHEPDWAWFRLERWESSL